MSIRSLARVANGFESGVGCAPTSSVLNGGKREDQEEGGKRGMRWLKGREETFCSSFVSSDFCLSL